MLQGQGSSASQQQIDDERKLKLGSTPGGASPSTSKGFQTGPGGEESADSQRERTGLESSAYFNCLNKEQKDFRKRQEAFQKVVQDHSTLI